jgi:hypothetical protein
VTCSGLRTIILIISGANFFFKDYRFRLKYHLNVRLSSLLLFILTGDTVSGSCQKSLKVWIYGSEP